MEDQIALGALLLWVRIDDNAEEEMVMNLLEKSGGAEVRAHTITRYWGVEDIPLYDFNPDPFL